MSHAYKSSALLRRLARLVSGAENTPGSVYKKELEKIVEQLTKLLHTLLNDVNGLPNEYKNVHKLFKKIIDDIFEPISEVSDFFGKLASSDPSKLMAQLPEIESGLQVLIKAIEKHIVHDKAVWEQIPERMHQRFDTMYEKLNSLKLSIDRLANEVKRDYEKAKRLQKEKGLDIDDADLDKALSEEIEKIQR
jgi:hypothetical protein